MRRRAFLLGTAAVLTTRGYAFAETTQATLYKDPACGCCGGYASYIRSNGFTVDVIPTADFAEIGRKAGVPESLEGCHAMFVDGYVVSGHVPIEVVRKLLAERPAIAGITLPGMPAGSPGMGGTKSETFTIYGFTNGGKAPVIYAAV